MKKIYLSVALLACTLMNAQSSWFSWDNVSYKGAFPVTDNSTGFSATQNWATGWTNWDCENTVYPAPTMTVTGDITSNTTWHSTDRVFLTGFTHVINNAELTIEPGCIISGAAFDPNTHTTGVLIITKGSKIHAVGTPSNPIIFTSPKAPGNRAPFDWGGVMLCGKAPCNKTSVTANPGETDQGYNVMKLEGFFTDDIKRHFGGIDVNDNSGEIKYVRIEFAGVSLNPAVENSEINSLTFGAVGRGTQIDFVQCSYGGDDSFEWFGGTVDCKHIISYRTTDDDFDTDMGFSGHIQYGLAIKDPEIADMLQGASTGESNGLECDNNDITGFNTVTIPSNPSPVVNWARLHTKAVFSNLTMVGPYGGDDNAYGTVNTATATLSHHQNGAHLRRNMAESVLNSIFVGYKVGLRFQQASTKDNLDPFQTANTDSSCTYGNNYILASKTSNFKAADADFPQTWYHTYVSTRSIDTTKIDADLKFVQSNFSSTTGLDNASGVALIPDFRLQVASVAALGASFTDPNFVGTWTGVKENSNIIGNVSLYPNPTSDVVALTVNTQQAGSLSIVIYDITGKLVATPVVNNSLISGENKFTINTAELNNGIYFVTLNSSKGKATVKLIVNK